MMERREEEGRRGGESRGDWGSEEERRRTGDGQNGRSRGDNERRKK